MEQKHKFRIGFIHPDLGIGGAEQLIVNMAVALKNCGHDVKIYTPYHNISHCFKETMDGTLEVEVRGNLFPRHIFHRFIALCAFIRMLFATIFIVFYGGHFDLIIVDQVPICLPILRLCGRKSLFYCHFPDKLLCTKRQSIFMNIYRFFMDLLEEVTILFANLVLVNSEFTKDVYAKSFKLLNHLKKQPEVLYPAINFDQYEGKKNQNLEKLKNIEGDYFLSINRYERKKNISLAVTSFNSMLQSNVNEFKKVKLVLAGGYDDRLLENVEHFKELESLIAKLNVKENVIMLKNITDDERSQLLKCSLAVLYTPANEHFGIVPVEAMYMEKPVLACNNGGPKESIKDKETGFLLPENDIEQWGQKLKYIVQNKKEIQEMGKTCKARAIQLFSLKIFQDKINQHVESILAKKQKIKSE